MKRREIEQELKECAREYPVITIIGPRQSGKTTLAKQVFSKYQYVNLENPEIRHLAESDPRSFFAQFPAPVILDEIQNVPELVSWVQSLVDENPAQKAQYIITGSHQLELNQQITQSLAGRTALLTLLPFSLTELKKYGKLPDRAELILNGFLPRVHQESLRPLRAYRDYYRTYVERDVRKLINLEKQGAFEQFIRLLAGRVGQELNLNSISGQIGVSAPQLKKWLGVLEASFIVFKLPPFYKNIGKRITKSPKLYFMDTGLVCYLLGIETTTQLERDPLFGNIFENMVVMDAFKLRYNQGKDAILYFYRDNHQNEVDLLFPEGTEQIPIEIKSSRTFHSDYTKGIRYFQKITGTSQPGVLIYDGELTPDDENYRAVNFRNWMRLMSAD